MPYAIIRAGGHQEKVAPGEQITVDHLKQEVGDEVTFTPLVISKSDGDIVSDHKELADAKAVVVGKILQHVKAEKIDVFQYRNKTGYRKHTGHRQQLTLVEISEIRIGGETFTAPPPPEPSAEPEKPAATEAKKKPAAKKSAAKKSAPKAAVAKGAPKKATAKGAPKKKK
jgi:large subunit ribosomal protein L21